MRDTYEIPLQVIVHCLEDGRMVPLRFRFEDHEGRMHTVQVEQIVDTHTMTYVGVEGFRYLCRAEDDGVSHLYELSFAFREHRWIISRILY